MVITLIGYRGTGKSTVAVPLAKRLGFDAIDADGEIERRAGCTIREIFTQSGEGAFREVERRVMSELLSRSRLVIAAGGGAVLDAGTRQRMIAAGPVVWLRASVATIEQRIAADASTASRRPPLTTDGGRAEIERILSLREPLYRQCATLTIEIDGRDVEELVALLVQELSPVLRGESPP